MQCNATAQVSRGVPVRDLLVPVVSKASKAEGRAALELYTRRIYRTHVVDNFSWQEQGAEGAGMRRSTYMGVSTAKGMRRPPTWVSIPVARKSDLWL